MHQFVVSHCPVIPAKDRLKARPSRLPPGVQHTGDLCQRSEALRAVLMMAISNDRLPQEGGKTQWNQTVDQVPSTDDGTATGSEPGRQKAEGQRQTRPLLSSRQRLG